MSQPDRNDLPNLRLFLAIVKRCSFSAAAIEFGLSPSAASHAIRRLEERLGVKLLNRTSRTVMPTELGRDLASKLTYGFDAIDTALQAFNSREGASLGVSAAPLFASADPRPTPGFIIAYDLDIAGIGRKRPDDLGAGIWGCTDVQHVVRCHACYIE